MDGDLRSLLAGGKQEDLLVSGWMHVCLLLRGCHWERSFWRGQ